MPYGVNPDSAQQIFFVGDVSPADIFARFPCKFFIATFVFDKLRGFMRVDLSVSKPIPKFGILSKTKSGENFLSVQNLFGHQYDTDTIYDKGWC